MKQAVTILILAACVMAGRFSTHVYPEFPGFGERVEAQASQQLPEEKRPAPKGTLTPKPIDAARPWGWMVRAIMDNPNRKLYNKAKAKMLSGGHSYGFSMRGPERGHMDPEVYCHLAAQAKNDHTWFEMQHSTQRFDQVQALIAACPGVGAAPLIRVPDALEGNLQKAWDLGTLGIVVPTVDDALVARDAARFSRTPPFGYRSSGGGTAGTFWNKFVPQGETLAMNMNDNALVILMIETVAGVNNALEIASVPGVDVVMLGQGDLQRFSGYSNFDDRFQDLLTRVRDATYLAGKFWGNSDGPVGIGNRLAPDSRFNQNRPWPDPELEFVIPGRAPAKTGPIGPTGIPTLKQ